MRDRWRSKRPDLPLTALAQRDDWCSRLPSV